MISKEELQYMYWKQGMSQSEIANEIKVSTVTVHRWMRKYRIKARTVSESLLYGTRILSKEELEHMYWDQEMTQSEIAKEIGVHCNTINNWMISYKIKTRTISECKLIGIYVLSKEELQQMYWEQDMSQGEIADEIGVSKNTVDKWMKRHGIEIRTKSEAMLNGDFAGENSSRWEGGISFEPYCDKFNNKFRAAVRERDDYTCQLCGHEQKLGDRKLDVHHVHYDKENCYPDVVTLCRSCNAEVNSNRGYWERYFELQLIERGLIRWSILQETIL